MDFLKLLCTILRLSGHIAVSHRIAMSHCGGRFLARLRVKRSCSAGGRKKLGGTPLRHWLESREWATGPQFRGWRPAPGGGETVVVLLRI